MFNIVVIAENDTPWIDYHNTFDFYELNGYKLHSIAWSLGYFESPEDFTGPRHSFTEIIKTDKSYFASYHIPVAELPENIEVKTILFYR